MKFAIRDDDVSYFTKPEQLERVYRDIWDKCPISISVVPFHACMKSKNIPREFWQGSSVFPLGDNRKLVAFLKEKLAEGKISIMLHGYSHKDYPGGPEFEAGEDLVKKVKEGKEYLQELLSVEIKTFVPPHNSISPDGIRAVIGNRLNLVHIPALRYFNNWKNLDMGIALVKRLFYRIVYRMDYPFVFHFRDYKALPFYSLIPATTFEWLKDKFDFCQRKHAPFCLATHHWEFEYSSQIKEVLHRFWDYVNGQEEIEFVTVDKILI